MVQEEVGTHPNPPGSVLLHPIPRRLWGSLTRDTPVSVSTFALWTTRVETGGSGGGTCFHPDSPRSHHPAVGVFRVHWFSKRGGVDEDLSP